MWGTDAILKIIQEVPKYSFGVKLSVYLDAQLSKTRVNGGEKNEKQ